MRQWRDNEPITVCIIKTCIDLGIGDNLKGVLCVYSVCFCPTSPVASNPKLCFCQTWWRATCHMCYHAVSRDHAHMTQKHLAQRYEKDVIIYHILESSSSTYSMAYMIVVACMYNQSRSYLKSSYR